MPISKISHFAKLFILLFLFQAICFAKIDLTIKEKQFLKDHPIITLGIGKGWIPYIIENNEGVLTGHNIDIVNEIEKHSGLKIKFHSDKWSKVLKEAELGNIDGLAMSVAHKERSNKFDFTNMYGSMQKLIFTRKQDEKISTLKQLEGKSLAVLESNLLELKIARKLENVKIVLFTSYIEAIKAVSLGTVDAMIGEVGILHVSNKIGMPYLEPSIFLEDKLNMVFSIRNDWPEATSIINKSLRVMGEVELLEIQHKWFLKNPSKHKGSHPLSLEEKGYLKKKKVVNVCIDPNWMPFEAFDENGKHIGLSSDYFDKFRKELDIPLNIIKTDSWHETLEFTKSRKCDVISLAMKTEQRSKYLNFTQPYLKTPLVLATKLDKSFVNDFNTLSNQKLGIPKGYAFVELLKKSYPNLNIIEVDNIHEGLEKVIDGKHFGYIGTLNSIGYLFQREFAGDLKIAGKFDEKWELGTAVRDDDKILLNIFNKLISNIDEKETQKIFNKWITLKYEEKVDYSLLIRFILFAFIIILIFVFWNKKLSSLVDEKTKELQDINQNLEKRIIEEVTKSKKIEQKLFQEEKMISIGELIGNIAHQWRQPLSIISTSASSMEVSKELGLLSDKEFYSSCKSINNSAQYLSKTIDDFRDYIKKDKKETRFYLHKDIENFLNLVDTIIVENNINIISTLDEKIQLNGFENGLIQSLINIFNNSKDALIENEIKNKLIFISTMIENDYVVIRVKDNGGGIPTNNLTKIFEPYFTTKHKSVGTGLGLHLAYNIIVESMKGTIEAVNKKYTYEGIEYKGAEFVITLPIK
ncbi:transporter substrate-binding domain-containing protein [Arcobacteraceae bacterium]|nr:transporter substrate-binding domain-containing protein [Arcobacteraceae bacterium]